MNEQVEELAAHRQSIEGLVPFLDAIRSIAELAWRRAEERTKPLEEYHRRLEMVFLEELDELAESDDALVARAEQHGRRISTLERLGPKKSRAVFIEFANSEN